MTRIGMYNIPEVARVLDPTGEVDITARSIRTENSKGRAA